MATNLKVLTWLYRSKKNAEEKAPIYIRITRGSQRIEIATGCYCRPSDWLSSSNSVTMLAPGAKEINDTIYLISTRIHIINNYLLRRGTEFHISEIKEKLFGYESKQTTLVNAIHYHNGLVRRGIGKNYANGTYKGYVWFSDKIKSFISFQYKRNDILLSELNHKFLTEFEHYLYHVLHNQVNTVKKNITQLKKVINMCIDLDWLDKMPFKRLKPKAYIPQRDFLTTEELSRMEELVITNKRLENIRDKFLFQCYTGVAFADLNNLTIDDIVKGIDGDDWIIIHRQKTGTRSTIPLLQYQKS